MGLFPVLLILVAAGAAAFYFLYWKKRPSPAPAPVSGPFAFSLNAGDWAITYSPGMPASPAAAPGGGWFLDVPIGPEGDAAFTAPLIPAVHYVTVGQNVNLGGRARLSADLKLETSGSPVFQYKLAPNNTCDHAAAAVLYFQRRGDDMSGAGAFEFYRWFSDPVEFTLANGSTTLSAPLDPASWISIMGKRGNADATAQAGFAAALADVANAGFTFGGGCFKGHGVNISQGSARFTVASFRAE